MSFLQAIFLLGIAGVAGPIAAHLLARPRYRRVPFTMLRFLQAGETESHARRRIRNFLILALRCVIIVLLALFFAGPERVQSAADRGTAPRLVIGIDDSLSMAAGSAFADAREAAEALVTSGADDTEFYLIGLASSRSIGEATRAEAMGFLNELAPIAGSVSIEPWLKRLRSLSDDREGRLDARLISDFTPQVRDALEAASGNVLVSSFDPVLVAHAPEPGNAAITGLDVAPGTERRLGLSAALMNYSDRIVEGTIGAGFGDMGSSPSPVSLAPKERRNVSLQVEWPDNAPEHLALEVVFECKDAIEEDNRYCVGLSLADSRARRVAVFSKNPREGHLLFSALGALAKQNSLAPMTVQNYLHGEMRPETLSGVDVVILASPPARVVVGVDELTDFVRRGGRLVAFMNAETAGFYASLWEAGVLPGNPVNYARADVALNPAFGSVVTGDALSEDGAAVRALRNYQLDTLPIRGLYTLHRDASCEVLWQYDSGEAFVSYRKAGEGDAVLVNTSADDAMSPLMKSPAAVAFVQYLVGGRTELQEGAFEAGQPVTMPVSDMERRHLEQLDRVAVLTPSGTSVSAVLMGDVMTVPALHEVGFVRTELKPVRFAGLNVPRGETDLSAPQESTLKLSLERLITVARGDETGGGTAATPADRQPLWPYIGWAAMMLMVLDVFVSNRITR